MEFIQFIPRKFQTVIDCFQQIQNSNPTTVIMSACVITFMIFMNEVLKVSKYNAKGQMPSLQVLN